MVTPTVAEVFAARAGVNQTQRQAAAVIGMSLRSWEGYETGLRPMPSQYYALYLHLTGQVKIPFGSEK